MPLRSKPKLTVAVLAAGKSERFGTADKLTQDLNGFMLGLHITQTLRDMDFANRFVIASSTAHPCASGWRDHGFSLVENEKAENGMGTSVALAAKRAMELYMDGLVICLADMPFVSREHVTKLVEEFAHMDDGSVVASYAGQAPSPPAVFGAALFPELMQLDGDKGARKWLSNAQLISAPPRSLIDIDTQSELTSLIDSAGL